MTFNLAELLRAEIVEMQPRQKTRFQRELKKTLPQAVKMAADRAKMAPEKPQGKNNVQNRVKK